MKKIILAILCFSFTATRSQTVDEIIQKYSDAVGGLNTFASVKTLSMTGNVAMQGMDMPMTVQIINGKAMKSNVEVMGQKIINLYKDGKGWTINPFAGATTPTEVTGSELNDLQNQANIANQLMDYKKRGNKVELQGEEDVDTVKCFKILLTRSGDNKTSTYFISTVDYLLKKSISTKDIQGQEVEIESYYNGYKYFDGLKISTDITVKMQGQVFQEIKFSDIKVNREIDEKVFDLNS
ncbi:MAG: hypothetical protein JST17_04670 [Bacteroidetes bacterium]|nr:hypothetical protein [Bacteroidota bacterium]MBS1929703.1 hypothetical protein [Bacteroidota bacterium]